MFHTKPFLFYLKIFNWVACVCFVSPVLSQNQYPSGKLNIKIKHRISFSPLLSFYKNDIHLTTNTKAQTGFFASYKAEFISGRRMNYTAGVEYVNQHVTFDGYFAAPTHTYIYDKTYSYEHDVQIQELQIPIGVKYSFAGETSYDYTPYFTGGMKFRYLLQSYTVITDDSTKTSVYDGNKPSITFESNIPTARINTCLYAGMGFQRNYRGKGRAIFFEMTFNYGISRFQYSGYNNSNNLAISNSFLAFTFGWKI
jgi:hypothetical protein